MLKILGVTIGGPLLLAVYLPSCQRPVVHPAPPDISRARMAELWERPANLVERDLLYGRWGRDAAPDPHATYQFVAPKLSGTNPGVKVRDPQGRRWHIKQAHPVRGAEGPIEVTLARVLEAVGYRQPPVFYLPSFTLTGDGGTRQVEGGRFRLTTPELEDGPEWSWQENPFVGSRPYNGLLAMLLLFNSTDLKNSNNVLYRYRGPNGEVENWYVVRDLGAALGETGRIEPRRGDVWVFERTRFIVGVARGYVQFHYHGFHRELVDDRISPADLRWACELLDGLTPQQWQDAFRAGGWAPDVSARYIAALRARVREGRRVSGGSTTD
jgi:hypothetical protein